MTSIVPVWGRIDGCTHPEGKFEKYFSAAPGG
jgi:hypothetical protein